MIPQGQAEESEKLPRQPVERDLTRKSGTKLIRISSNFGLVNFLYNSVQLSDISVQLSL